jgi:hypothetical protein
MEIIKAAVNKQQYAGPETGNLMASVKKVAIVLGAHSLMSIGYGDKGEVLAIRYCDYNNLSADWISDFYEHQFITEPLLAEEGKVTTAFISTERTLIVPANLYNAEVAAAWLSKMYLVENDDVVSEYKLENDQAQLVYAWPQMIQDLVKRYFPNAIVLPLNAAQLNKSAKDSGGVQCIVSLREAAITLYNAGKLLWSETMRYATAEDIAYRIQHLCITNGLDAPEVRCTCTSSELMLVVSKLTQYFPNLNTGDGQAIHAAWEAPVSLSRQLYKCVS